MRWMQYPGSGCQKYGRYISSKLSISPRDREVLIVRCAVKTQSIYEWGHHVKIAKSVGITDQDLEQLRLATPSDMSAIDMALVHACDELLTHTEISTETFQLLSENFNTSSIMEIISVVGLYNWTAMLLKSFHVRLEGAISQEIQG